MEQLKAFTIKFIGVGVITFSFFGIFFHATIGRLLFITLIVAGVTYIGDLFILQRINRAVGAIADFGVYFLLFWALGNLVVEGTASLILPAFAAAYLATAAEAVFHIYMLETVHGIDTRVQTPGELQTEFAEEADVEGAIKDEEEKREK